MIIRYIAVAVFGCALGVGATLLVVPGAVNVPAAGARYELRQFGDVPVCFDHRTGNTWVLYDRGWNYIGGLVVPAVVTPEAPSRAP
jgi:hypothetical protein